MVPVIPLKGVYLPNEFTLTSEDFYDTKLYRKRHIIERIFSRLKENKRIAMRFDKLGCLSLALSLLLLLKLIIYFVNSAILGYYCRH